MVLLGGAYMCLSLSTFNQTASHTDEDQLGIRGVYDTIWKICKLPRKLFVWDQIKGKTTNVGLTMKLSSCRYAFLYYRSPHCQDWIHLQRRCYIIEAFGKGFLQRGLGAYRVIGLPIADLFGLLCSQVVQWPTAFETGKYWLGSDGFIFFLFANRGR